MVDSVPGVIPAVAGDAAATGAATDAVTEDEAGAGHLSSFA